MFNLTEHEYNIVLSYLMEATTKLREDALREASVPTKRDMPPSLRGQYDEGMLVR